MNMHRLEGFGGEEKPLSQVFHSWDLLGACGNEQRSCSVPKKGWKRLGAGLGCAGEGEATGSVLLSEWGQGPWKYAFCFPQQKNRQHLDAKSIPTLAHGPLRWPPRWRVGHSRYE